MSYKMSYKKGFYIMFVLYGISILTIVLSLPDINTVFGNKDLGNDVIESGAFASSFKKQKPHQVKLL